MTRIVLTELIVPTAATGPENPLPCFDPPVPPTTVRPDVPADIAERTHEGAPLTILPYLRQDGYERELTPQPLRVAILENERIRATVALDLGGRVWSLRDLEADRELLYVNPVVQPCNLALRNAWVSGGIEWNIGTRGHSPTTMSTLHAARVVADDGTEILRLWEWERMRRVIFQIDLWLPEDAPVLAATVRIQAAPADLEDGQRTIPTYWWTNAAVVAGRRTRVLSPAIRAVRTEYPASIRMASVPQPDPFGPDVTVLSENKLAADYFFDIGATPHPWVAAVDGLGGAGVFHQSTKELRGHKLFVWGTTKGGPNWQRWLSHDGEQHYAEIQAGLAPTQFEHIPIPGDVDVSWTEVFGGLTVDPEIAGGANQRVNWIDAIAHTSATIDAIVGSERLDRWHAAAIGRLDVPPTERLAKGSGWGAFERRDRERVGGCDPLPDSGTPFDDDTLGPEQEPWIELYENAILPDADPSIPPASYLTDDGADSMLAQFNDTWLSEYHRGVYAHANGDLDAAHEHYENSVGLLPNAWALRGMAEVARQQSRPALAASLARSALVMVPGNRYLAVEAIERLLDADRGDEALQLIDELPTDVRGLGRVQLLEGFAAVAADQPERAQRILDDGLVVPDLREGERSIDELWALVYPDDDLPPEYDFRMH